MLCYATVIDCIMGVAIGDVSAAFSPDILCLGVGGYIAGGKDRFCMHAVHVFA